jgi:hypothetical protein
VRRTSAPRATRLSPTLIVLPVPWFCGFAVLDDHLHVLVRLEPDAANGWSAEDVVRRWFVAYPPKSADAQTIEVTQA